MATSREIAERNAVNRDSVFVQPDEFLQLLLSRKALIRADSSDGLVRGLFDQRTGRRYLIEQDKLRNRQQTA